MSRSPIGPLATASECFTRSERTSALLPTAGALAHAVAGSASSQQDAQAWVGVMVTATPEGIRACDIMHPSGSPDFDRQACVAASRPGALVYSWPGTGRTPTVRASLLFVSSQGRPMAILPRSTGITGGRLTHEDWVEVTASVRAAAGPRADLAGMRLSLDLDVHADVTRCEITASAGDGAFDAAACRAVRASDRFPPGREIFGWVLPTTLADWSLAPSA